MPWSNVALVNAPAQALLLQDQPPGDWEFRATEVDDGNVASTNQPTASISVPFDGPSGVNNFVAAIA
jgi:hypothetical protein